jgi:hypothetical protein
VLTAVLEEVLAAGITPGVIPDMIKDRWFIGRNMCPVCKLGRLVLRKLVRKKERDGV